MANKLRSIFSTSDEELLPLYEWVVQHHHERIGACCTCTHYIPTDMPGFVTDYGDCGVKNPVFVDKVCSEVCHELDEHNECPEYVEKPVTDLERKIDELRLACLPKRKDDTTE